MDLIDQKILEILQIDAMKTAKEMAAELALTTTPIYERIKRMEQSGLIKQYVALLDADLIGKNIVVFMHISMVEHQLVKHTTTVDRISKLAGIQEFYQTSGSSDFIAKGRFSSVKEFRDFLFNELYAIETIKHVESQIVLEVIKYETKIALA